MRVHCTNIVKLILLQDILFTYAAINKSVPVKTLCSPKDHVVFAKGYFKLWRPMVLKNSGNMRGT